MSEVFLSYAREDQDAAMALAKRLESAGLSVWWDRKIPPGQTFREVIQEQLATTCCVVVLWSEASIASDWVLDEAEEGRVRQCLVPIRLEEAIPPLGFRRIHAVPLPRVPSSWPKDAISVLVEAVQKVVRESDTPIDVTNPQPLTHSTTTKFDNWLATGPNKATMWATLSMALALLTVHVELFFEFGNSMLVNGLVGPMLAVGLWVGVAGLRRGSWSMCTLGWIGPIFTTYVLPSAHAGIFDLIEELAETALGALVVSAGYLSLSYLVFSAIQDSWRPDHRPRHLEALQDRLPRLHFAAASLALITLSGALAGWPANGLWFLALRLAGSTLLIVGTLRALISATRGHNHARNLLPIAAAIVLIGGNFQVRVTDSDGHAIPGVIVELQALSRTTITDQTGTVALPMVPLGVYDASVEIAGFETRFERIYGWPFFSLGTQVAMRLSPLEGQTDLYSDSLASELGLAFLFAALAFISAALPWPFRVSNKPS